MITPVKPDNGASVKLLTDFQRRFLRDEKGRAGIPGEKSFERAFDGKEHTHPRPVMFSWEDDGEYGEGNYILVISRNPDLSSPSALITDRKSARVYNLMADTRYYWCVQKEGRRSEIREFRTADEYPRFIHIDGISNVRDMGGIRVSGGTIKQGMIYRGGEFDLHMHITAKGMKELLDLGIRTDIDMRGESVGKVEYGAGEPFGIRRVLIPTPGYNVERDSESYIKILRMLTDETVYPVYHHCWGGADRGGTLSLLIESVCGADDKAITDDYELTSLSIWGRRTRNYGEFANMLEVFRGYEGGSISGCVQSWLRSHGLSEDEMRKIRSIIVES